MKTKVVILGGKGTAVNIAEGIYDAANRFNAKVEMLGFAFDDEKFGDSINGFPILCKTTEVFDKFRKYSDVKFIFQMNHQNKMRERAKLIQSYKIPSNKWFTFIHPSAFVSKSAKIGHGTVVYTHCAIHANSVIGNHCTFSASTTIGHDTIINDNVFTATHVCIGSQVYLEECNFLGQNSTIIGSVRVSAGNLIGLGSNVLKDVTISDHILVGTPAKPLKSILN